MRRIILLLALLSIFSSYGKAQGQTQLNIPDLRNALAKQYLDFKEQVWAIMATLTKTSRQTCLSWTILP